MPIEYLIDHERRLVMAKGQGTLTDEDVFGFQRDVWSRPEVNGCNELVLGHACGLHRLQSIQFSKYFLPSLWSFLGCEPSLQVRVISENVLA